MKQRLSLWLALAVLATLPLMAQDATLARIHGRVIDPTGMPKNSGTVSLSQDGGKTALYSFPVSAQGDYKGEAKPGTYDVVYRQPETPADKMVDDIPNVKLVANTDTTQDLDMSRKEYIDKMTPEQKQQVEEFKKKNAEILKTNSVIKNLNADSGVCAAEHQGQEV